MSYFLQHSDFVTVMVRSIQSTCHFVMYFTRQKYKKKAKQRPLLITVDLLLPKVFVSMIFSA